MPEDADLLVCKCAFHAVWIVSRTGFFIAGAFLEDVLGWRVGWKLGLGLSEEMLDSEGL